VFQWHLDAFELPHQATLLATNEETPYQAFRYGSKAYGLQYHIEVLSETFQQWLQMDAGYLRETLGPEVITQLTREWETKSAAYHRQSTLMFANFLQLAGLPVPETPVGSGGAV
jgi:GMP synthase (glutamine-hydrolysing)